MPRGFSLIKRVGKHGTTYYVRLPGETSMRSTGKSNKYDAEQWVRANVLDVRESENLTLQNFLLPYFTDRDRCPHLRRLKTAGRTLSPKYIHDNRRLLDTYVCTSHTHVRIDRRCIGPAHRYRAICPIGKLHGHPFLSPKVFSNYQT